MPPTSVEGAELAQDLGFRRGTRRNESPAAARGVTNLIDNNGSASRDAALDFLYSRIDYERSPANSYSDRTFKLDRMSELLARIGDPQQQLRIVHVAGTKGKGSTAAMIAAMLTAAGYRVGLFSSPHMFRVEERLAIDGVPCSAAEFIDLLALRRTARPRDGSRGNRFAGGSRQHRR